MFLQSSVLIFVLISLSACMSGIVSRKDVERATCSASLVDKDISDCDLDF